MSTNAQKVYNLTEGPILNKLLVVAVPIMGTQLLQMLYNLTDMFWLGRVGSDAVAASGSAGMYLWLSMALMMIGRMGAEIGVSQSLGKREPDAARSYAYNALLLSVGLGILFGGSMIVFRNPLIGFFGIREQHVAQDAATYLAITGAAIAPTYISAAVTGAFNGSGNSRTPFFINAVGLVVNMILDPVLIIYLDWGITGAAVATSLAQVLVAVIFLIAMKKGSGRPFSEFRLIGKPQMAVVKQIFRWSIPIAVESMLFTFLSMVIARVVAGFGSQAMAVQRVGSQIESLSWLIGGGFSSAVTAFVGQNYGAQKWSRIHRGFRISIQTMLVWGILVTLILFFGARILFTLFLPEAELVGMGIKYLRILAACQLVACLEFNCAGAFRGIGKTLPPSISSAAGNLLRIPLVLWLSSTSLGIDGIWWGITIGASIRSLWMIIWFVVMTRKLPKQDVQPEASSV